MVAMLVLNFSILFHIGFFLLPLYALATTAILSEPGELMQASCQRLVTNNYVDIEHFQVTLGT